MMTPRGAKPGEGAAYDTRLGAEGASRSMENPREMRVLGIETSCDETGVALYDSAAGVTAQALYTQIPLHALYGGVVPELASRDHVRRLLPLIRQTLGEAGLSLKDIDGVAYTAGPGLVGALLVGAAWDTLLEGNVRTLIERDLLVSFLQRQRWFGGKGRRVRSARFIDWCLLQRGLQPLFLTLV